ncbi:MAG: hypothetical protein ACRD0Z_15415 [Acidimicrobiales bacterium]
MLAAVIVVGSFALASSEFFGAAPAAQAKTSLSTCELARERIANSWPDASAIPCVKVERLAKTAPTGEPSSSSSKAKAARVTHLMPTSIQAPANDGEILTTDIDQSAVPGTVITALWMDLESSMYVQVQSGSEGSDATQGTIDIRVLNPTGYVIDADGQAVTEANGTVDGYGGGEYVVPGLTGPVTLTSITGTLTAGDMVVNFSYSGGSGSFTPVSAAFSG